MYLTVSSFVFAGVLGVAHHRGLHPRRHGLRRGRPARVVRGPNAQGVAESGAGRSPGSDLGGRPVRSSGRPVRSSGRPVGSSGRPVGSSGRPVGSSGSGLGGRPVRSSSRSSEASASTSTAASRRT